MDRRNSVRRMSTGAAEAALHGIDLPSHEEEQQHSRSTSLPGTTREEEERLQEEAVRRLPTEEAEAALQGIDLPAHLGETASSGEEQKEQQPKGQEQQQQQDSAPSEEAVGSTPHRSSFTVVGPEAATNAAAAEIVADSAAGVGGVPQVASSRPSCFRGGGGSRRSSLVSFRSAAHSSDGSGGLMTGWDNSVSFNPAPGGGALRGSDLAPTLRYSPETMMKIYDDHGAQDDGASAAAEDDVWIEVRRYECAMSGGTLDYKFGTSFVHRDADAAIDKDAEAIAVTSPHRLCGRRVRCCRASRARVICAALVFASAAALAAVGIGAGMRSRGAPAGEEVAASARDGVAAAGVASSLPPVPPNLSGLCSPDAVSVASGYEKCKELCVKAECCYFDAGHALSCRGDNEDACGEYESDCMALDLDTLGISHHKGDSSRGDDNVQEADRDEKFASEAVLQDEEDEEAEAAERERDGLRDVKPAPPGMALMCSADYIKIEEGRASCERACSHGRCCFPETTAVVEDGRGVRIEEQKEEPCRPRDPSVCEGYQVCSILHGGNAAFLEGGPDERFSGEPSPAIAVTDVPPAPSDLPALCSGSPPADPGCARACEAAACCAAPIEECRVSDPDACGAYHEPCAAVWGYEG